MSALRNDVVINKYLVRLEFRGWWSLRFINIPISYKLIHVICDYLNTLNPEVKIINGYIDVGAREKIDALSPILAKMLIPAKYL